MIFERKLLSADSMQDFESGSFVSAVNSPEYLALKAQAKQLETPVGKQKKRKKKTKKQKTRLAVTASIKGVKLRTFSF